MSKKRLRNKNIKTKKIKGGLDLINSLKSGLEKKADSFTKDLESKGDSFTKDLESKGDSFTKGLESKGDSFTNDLESKGDSFTSKADSFTKGLESKADSLTSEVESKADSLTSKVENKVNNVTKDLEKEAESLTNDVTSKALSMVPGASTALSIESAFNSTIQKIMVPPTPGDKFRQALINLSTNTDFKYYFEHAINKIMVSEFYKILTTLGEYSKLYSDTVEKIVDITGASMFDDDVDFYSDLNIFPVSTINKVVEPDCTLLLEQPVTDKELKQLNVDKILDDTEIEEFLEDAMIIGVPVIENIFELLGKTIAKYKKIRNKMNALLEKTDDIEKHFEDFRKLSNEAIEQINDIFNHFDTSNMRGGSDCSSEGKEPTMPSDKDDFKAQSLFYEPDNNKDCTAESAIKMVQLTKLYEEKQNRIDAKDDFYNTLLKMCITGRNNLSKLLKQKISTILNRIIKRLYDIANAKNIINGDEIRDDEDFSDYKYLKEGEDKIVDFVPSEYPLFQQTIANTTKQLFCKIQKKPKIDTQLFKDIVKPAFINKMEQLRDLVKIWSTDVFEKERLIKKLKGDVDEEITKYVTDLKEQIQIAVDTQKGLKEYIKSAKEKEKEEQKKREKELAIELKTGAENFKKQEEIEAIRMEKADKNNVWQEQEKMIEKRKENDKKFKEEEEKQGDLIIKGEEARKKTEENRILRNRKENAEIKRLQNIKNNRTKYLEEQMDVKANRSIKAIQDEMIEKRKENDKKFKEQLEKENDLIIKGEEARKKITTSGGRTTRKFSSPISQKTRRRRQTFR